MSISRAGTTKGTQMSATINHQTEAMIAENHGHELGCFEILAERVVESLPQAAIETGAFLEEIDGMTILERMIQRLTDPSECSCEAGEDEE